MINTPKIASCIARLLLLAAALPYADAQTDSVLTSAGKVPGLMGLNAAQRETVTKFVLEHEQPTGELKRLAERGGITVRTSAALAHLFPHSRFVKVPWIFQLDPAAKNLYSIPGGLFDVLAISDQGLQESTFYSSGNSTEFGVFLHAHRIKVRNKTMADEVARAFADIYQLSLCCSDVKHGPSEWYLGYRELPFRPVSSYEEERDVFYYRLTVDSNGVVLNGTLVNKVLERRKIEDTERPAGDH
jgi:hypothetical protein